MAITNKLLPKYSDCFDTLIKLYAIACMYTDIASSTATAKYTHFA